MAWDVGIVGGGAAGLMTAIVARREAPALSVVLFEGARRPGAKILISGGGRCNVTNRSVRPSDFNGDRGAIARVLRRFDAAATVAFFRTLGVELKHEPEFDKLFPVTDSARTVLTALLDEALHLGVRLLAPFRVESIACADGFSVASRSTSEQCRRLVLATGGRSLPKSGSDGLGYELARSLGHSITPTAPALVPLVLEPNPFRAFSGVSFPAEIAIQQAGRRVATLRGPLLATHFGLSGPSALDASRHWTTSADPRPDFLLNLFPGVSPSELEARWVQLARKPGRPVARSLFSTIPARLALFLLAAAGIAVDTPLATLDRIRRRALLALATALPLPVTGTRGWNEAEVTAGGVPLEEVDLRTMESRRCPGLHLVGEILDVDGRLGGFNFQWAWSTGHIAGQALALSKASA